ncbi:SIR2 family protein [Clostridium sp. ZBS4]|uniref:SIR2 family protein n=1 Tax=Clostridium sp. ZBS4 TaxID=2949974 RepID=UPI002079C56E|nr:SIR2 family protein [Clostridium sp. ZBS4]
MIENTITDIRTWGAVVILGAGASYQAGMPLCGQLAPLLWYTCQGNNNVMNQLRQEFPYSSASSAKEIIGEEFNRIKKAFNLIENCPGALLKFKEGFKRLNDAHLNDNISAYISLAKLIHDEHMECVISLNWDSLLEAAWEKLYGTDINADKKVLYKPHGSVISIDEKWILPNSDGEVQEEIVKLLEIMEQDRPRNLIIVGYSESDKVIVDKIIKPLSSIWKIVRISPDAIGKNNLDLSATEAFSTFEKKLCNQNNKFFEQITFNGQRDMLDAILGKRLYPCNVKNCPELPHVKSIKRQLEIDNCVLISGEAGSGKSITAYQIAYHYNKLGWEVLKCNQDFEFNFDMLQTLKRKSVIIIDDMQIYKNVEYEKIRTIASKNIKIICTITGGINDDINVFEDVYISNKQSVELLVKEYSKRKKEVYSIVKKLDNRIGDAYLDETIEYRIDKASEAENPWMFNYILRGGWNNAKKDYQKLEDYDNANYLLVILVMYQICNLDASIKKSELERLSEEINKDISWLNRAINYAVKCNMIFKENEKYRCYHIQYASILLNVFMNKASSTEIEWFIKIAKILIKSDNTPVQGICWFLNEFHLADRWGRVIQKKLIESEEMDYLSIRCMEAKTDLDIRNSTLVIDSLLKFYENVGNKICNKYAHVICEWINNVNEVTGYALSGLINSLYNKKETSLDEIKTNINIASFVGKINTCTYKDIGAIGNVFRNLWKFNDKIWRNKIEQQIDIAHAIRLVEYNQEDIELYKISSYIVGIYSLNKEKGLQIYDASENIFIRNFRKDPLSTFEEIDHTIIWIILGYSIFNSNKPKKKLAERAKKLVKAISALDMANKISKSNRHDWERYARFLDWINRVNKKKTKEIVEQINFDEFDKQIGQYWEEPPRELRLIIVNLAEHSKVCKPIESLIMKHEKEIKVVDPLIAMVAPEIIVSVYKNGGVIDIFAHNDDFGLASQLLILVYNKNLEIAKEILYKSQEKIISEITDLWTSDCEDLGLYYFITVTKDIDNNFLIDILSKVDTDKAAVRWNQCIKIDEVNNKKYTNNINKSIFALCCEAEKCEGDIGRIAKDILKKIPENNKYLDK